MSQVLSAKENSEDRELNSIRPQSLDEYIGQSRLKENLKIFIGAAKRRKEVLDHVLLYGPPGLGKTTLAAVIANEMNSKLVEISGPTIDKAGDLISVLTSLEPGDILFIDEIHRIPRSIEEILYSAMEDFKISVSFQRDSGTQFINLDIAPFTLIGATTRAGDLSSPLRDRFGINEKLHFYSQDEIQLIIKRTAKILGSSIEDLSSDMLAKRSRGTPRIANRLFRRVRDFSDYRGHKTINRNDVIDALKSLRVDCLGLDEVDIKYLETLHIRFKDGPVGLENIASTIGEETTNLEDVCEPYLLQIGLINRTPKGRVLTQKAVSHLKKYHQEDN